MNRFMKRIDTLNAYDLALENYLVVLNNYEILFKAKLDLLNKEGDDVTKYLLYRQRWNWTIECRTKCKNLKNEIDRVISDKKLTEKDFLKIVNEYVDVFAEFQSLNTCSETEIKSIFE